jgi:hypothetical protein
MPVDLSGLIAAVTEAETVDASAVALIEGFAASVTAAVTAALQADDAADQGSIDAANTAIQGEVSRLVASKAKVATAITANTPAA